MTLTTEQLRERIGHLKERLRDMKQHKYPDNCPNAAAYLESLKGERQQDIELLEELLANREAQPVLYASEETLAYAKEGEKSLVTWSEPMGDAVFPLHTAPPAPAVPDALVNDIDSDDHPLLWSYNNGWNACRAAMLAQPVSSDYKLVPVEPTESMIIDGFESDAFMALADAVNEKNSWPYGCRESAECVEGIFKAMLAAAPTQGKDNE
ncbi:hypothetical protein QZQ41_17185 [Serratia marcescens]|uniref:hypothetical protein n=1 Tax=Serratia marcescens TaxID=615 RepID=UPI00276B173B|nr:hypothetical protein [Serratia marcescens]MDP8656323.1 hypothetical protein [Serratia marcescens]MDP8661307.1 hypothetical protein [Serratia marcescens]MDP8720547.1 hypothetical protein [Serratia marcescens]MDP8874736.1 hypothetical protein [Serratia marcescens]